MLCDAIFSLQQAGFTVVAEKLNFYRYLSHFRAVHRGAFFSEMRTTSVRKLLPEAWGETLTSVTSISRLVPILIIMNSLIVLISILIS